MLQYHFTQLEVTTAESLEHFIFISLYLKYARQSALSSRQCVTLFHGYLIFSCRIDVKLHKGAHLLVNLLSLSVFRSSKFRNLSLSEFTSAIEVLKVFLSMKSAVYV
jgi:hypothetical protein